MSSTRARMRSRARPQQQTSGTISISGTVTSPMSVYALEFAPGTTLTWGDQDAEDVIYTTDAGTKIAIGGIRGASDSIDFSGGGVIGAVEAGPDLVFSLDGTTVTLQELIDQTGGGTGDGNGATPGDGMLPDIPQNVLWGVGAAVGVGAIAFVGFNAL